MKTYGRDQVLEFLAEIDDILAEPVALEIIGGAAALLAYGAQSATKDIDSFASIDEKIRQAATRVAHKIPLEQGTMPSFTAARVECRAPRRAPSSQSRCTHRP